jgi:UDP-glucose 4-epimerase
VHYIITGGAGFIGSHLADRLLALGHAVTIFDDLSSGKQQNVPVGAQFVKGDIRDKIAFAEAIETAQGCFHLAAVASVSRSLEEWFETHSINQGGTVQVFEACARRHIPVVYASSAAVFGDNPTLPLGEDSSTHPLSPYGLDKLLCEYQAIMGQTVLNLASAGMRFFNVYGPRQDPNSPYSGVISIFMRHLQDNKPLPILGDGLQTRDFIYVGDVVSALVAAMEKLHQQKLRQEVFNICTGKAVTVLEMAKTLCDIAKRHDAFNHLPPREGDIRHSRGNPSKMQQTLGVTATTTLSTGLEQTWLSYVNPS